MTNLPARRPAETVGFAAGLAVLICYFLGVDDPGVLAAFAVVIGGLPGIVTWIVDLTGKRGS